MPYTDSTPSLPFAGKTTISRHCSHEAAKSAGRTRADKSNQYFMWLVQVNEATDWGAVDHFNWPMSTVCSVRNGLVDRGRVRAVGSCEGRYGKKVTIWGPL